MGLSRWHVVSSVVGYYFCLKEMLVYSLAMSSLRRHKGLVWVFQEKKNSFLVYACSASLILFKFRCSFMFCLLLVFAYCMVCFIDKFIHSFIPFSFFLEKFSTWDRLLKWSRWHVIISCCLSILYRRVYKRKLKSNKIPII